MRKRFWLGVLVGTLGCMAMLTVAAIGVALYVHAGPGNTYLFSSEHIISISVVRAPEQVTTVQANELLKLNAQVLDAALDLQTQEARLTALAVWYYRLVVGGSPYGQPRGEMPVIPPKGKEL